MPNTTLLDLLEADKEMIMGNLARDRAPEAAQAVVEKAIDRVMYRYVEACDDDALRSGAQHLLQTMKNTVPLMGAVGEAREWKKTVEAPRRGLRPSAWGFLIAGAVLVLAGTLALMIGGGFNPLSLVKGLLPALLGGASLFWAGRLAAKPAGRNKPDSPANIKTEFLIDADIVWHGLRGAMLMADHQLETIAQDAKLERQQAKAEGGGSLPAGEVELFAQLLESAYAMDGAAAREMISEIRFYLHNAQMDVVDYEPGRESWFEFLPARQSGTLRPALASEGRLVKKGLAAK